MFVIAFNIRYIDISTAVYQIRLRLWNFTKYLHSNDEYWSITTCQYELCAIVDIKMPWLYAAIIDAWSFMKAQRKLCFFGRSIGFRRDLQASAADDPRTILGSYMRYKVRRRKREFSNPFNSLNAISIQKYLGSCSCLFISNANMCFAHISTTIK